MFLGERLRVLGDEGDGAEGGEVSSYGGFIGMSGSSNGLPGSSGLSVSMGEEISGVGVSDFELSFGSQKSTMVQPVVSKSSFQKSAY